MRRLNGAMVILLALAVTLSGCKQDRVAEKSHEWTLEESGQDGIMKVTLTPRAVERIGIETVPVREEMVSLAGAQASRKVVPYGAIMYDKKGHTWTFTSPQPNVYVRQAIEVETIDGDRVVLAEGPPTGTAVVTVGAPELMGVEHKYGH
jgi:hypothetical protein